MTWQSQLSDEEWAQRERFEAAFLRGQSPVMRTIEKSVCGCDYGGDSWTTRSEADAIVSLLGVKRGVKFLDLGAGAGWPGIYMTAISNCSTVLVDLPFAGLCIAAKRAAKDGLSDNVRCICSDASALPIKDDYFDAISHSDLLCCLKQKRAVLGECRRTIRSGAKMVFTVIYIAPNASETDFARAVKNGPEFIAADESYEQLLADTGWNVMSITDITGEFALSVRRQLDADEKHKQSLRDLFGARELEERIKGWRSKLPVIEERLIRRDLIVAVAG